MKIFYQLIFVFIVLIGFVMCAKEKEEPKPDAEDFLHIIDIKDAGEKEVEKIEEEKVVPECNTDKDCADKFTSEEMGQCKKPICIYETKTCMLENIEDGTSCNDNDNCTETDACKDGVCVGEENKCDCKQNEDCKVFEDGDLCNGTYKCDLEKFPYKCIIDPETIVQCDSSQDTECISNICDKEKGECKMTPINEGKDCNDKDECTINEICKGGECIGTLFKDCNDDNPCTDDECEPEKGCIYIPNSASCEDGNLCTENDYCENKECKGGTPVNCDDKIFCNGEEICDPLKGCLTGKAQTCDDGNPCTKDWCDFDSDKCKNEQYEDAKEGPKGSLTCNDNVDNDCDNLIDNKDDECNLEIISITPSDGVKDVGTIVKIAGGGFKIVKEVKFGEKDAKHFKIISDTLIEAVTPYGNVGNVDVKVGNGWVTTILEGGFRYTGIVQPSIDLWGNFHSPASITIKENETTQELYGRVYVKGITDADEVDGEKIVAEVGYGWKGTLPWKYPLWKWQSAEFNKKEGKNFEYKTKITPEVGGYYILAYRYSIDDGYNYLYADMAEGTENGFSAEKCAEFTIWGIAEKGKIVINEIMWMGSYKDPKDEWIELRNMTSAPFDLTGWLITNAGISKTSLNFNDDKFTVKNIILKPYGYFLISQFDKENEKSSLNVDPDIIANNKMVLLNNPPVKYELKTKEGISIDEALYSGKHGSKDYINNIQMSMERNKIPSDGTLDENWHTATTHTGWDDDPLQEKNFGTPKNPNEDMEECFYDYECNEKIDLPLKICEIPVCNQKNFKCEVGFVEDGWECDDGLWCTEKDACSSGICKGKEKTCDDGIPCTIDKCIEDEKKCSNDWDPQSVEGPKGDPSCNDKNDNDCDKLTDGDDPQCLFSINEIFPLNGIDKGGVKVLISGEKLEIAKKVLFGKNNAQTFKILSSNQIESITPSGDVGDVDVSVSDGVVTSTLTLGFKYTGVIEDATGLWGNVQWPENISINVGETTPMIYGRVKVEGITDSNGDPDKIIAEVGYGPPQTNPYENPDWVWVKAEFNDLCDGCFGVFEYMGKLTPLFAGNYIVAYRYSIDEGYHYLYADFGAGTEDGFSPETSLLLTVEE